MIEITSGNLLEDKAEALVNTVNTHGVMGKGIALQFKKAFPDNFKAYEAACKRGEVQVGKMFITEPGMLQGPKYIINFPTKRHWKGNSRIEDIEDGLRSLVQEVQRLKITSIAIPPLGCGLGGLPWQRIHSMIEKAFSPLHKVKVLLYAPKGAPKAEDIRDNTKHPNMTTSRALFLCIMNRYLSRSFMMALSLVEAQKLFYFLQEAGEPLRLSFNKDRYGPYADNLRHVLQRMEKHYIIGYGDGTANAFDPILQILPKRAEAAAKFLQKNKEALSRLDRVESLFDGFESAYGAELLATVHWVAINELELSAVTPEEVTASIRKWSTRKEHLFTIEHVANALEQLAAHQFLPAH